MSSSCSSAVASCAASQPRRERRGASLCHTNCNPALTGAHQCHDCHPLGAHQLALISLRLGSPGQEGHDVLRSGTAGRYSGAVR